MIGLIGTRDLAELVCWSPLELDGVSLLAEAFTHTSDMPVMCLTSGRKICGDNGSEPLRAPTVRRKQRDLKRFCGLPSIQGQNIRSVGNLGPWESWSLWTTQCREIQTGS